MVMQTSRPIDRVLVTGATGRTGRHVVAAAAARGLTPVALARNGNHAQTLLPGTQIAVGDLEDRDSLATAVPDVDAVIFVHGFGADQRADSAERIDYGGVADVLRAPVAAPASSW